MVAATTLALTACSLLQEDGSEKSIRINLPPIVSASGNSRSISDDRLPTLKTETRRYRVTVNGMVREGTESSYEFTLTVGIRATVTVEGLNSSGEVIIRAVKDFTVAGGDNIIDINLKNDGNEIIPSAPQPVPNQVTYNYGEATLGNPSGLPSDPATYNEGDLFTVADGANMTWQHGLNGGGFTEWITNVALEGDDASSTADVQAGNAVIVNGKYKMPAGGVVLTAQWTKRKYSLTYDDNVPAGKSGTVNGKPANQNNHDALTKVTVGSEQPTLTVSNEVWNFKGYWTDDAAGSGTHYSAGQEITLTGDTTLYAQWTNEAVWRVSFAEPSSNKPSAYTQAMPTNDVVQQGQPFTWTANPAATGWRFDGWNVNGSTPMELDATTTQITPNSDITLTAKWIANTYTINLNTSNSNWSGATGTISGNATVSATYDTATTLPAITAPTGYTFAGWTRTSGGTAADNTITQSGGSYTATNLSSTQGATVDLYPVWTAGQYTVTYSVGSGNVPQTSAVTNWKVSDTYTVGTTAITLPTLSATGYTFGGWQINGTAQQGGATYTPTASVTATAQWTVNSYQVTYVLDGGSGGPASGNVQYNTNVSLGAPTKTGYTFTGWSDGSTTYGGTSGNDSLTMPAQAITLTAQWTPIAYTITYDANGGGNNPNSTTFTVADSSVTFASSNTLAKTGYTCMGWETTGGIDISNMTNPADLINLMGGGTTLALRAKWEGELKSTPAVGDIIMNDGTLKKYTDTITASNAIAVVYKVEDGKAWAVGGQLNYSLKWADSAADGYGKDRILITTVNGNNFTGYIDGSTGLEILHGAIGDSNPSASDFGDKYPAWNFACNYGTNMSLDNFATGWYFPSVKEVYEIYTQKAAVDNALFVVGGSSPNAITFSTKKWWSSSIPDPATSSTGSLGTDVYPAYALDFSNGDVVPLNKGEDWNADTGDNYGVCTVRVFTY